MRISVDYKTDKFIEWDSSLNAVGKLYFPLTVHIALQTTHREVMICLFGTEERVIFP